MASIIRRRELLKNGRLPSGFQEVEWIGNSGSSNRIDTAVKPDSTLYGFSGEFYLTSQSSDWNIMNLGGTGTDNYRYGVGGYNGSLQVGRPMYNYSWSNYNGILINTRYTFEYFINQSAKTVLNGVDVITNIPYGNSPYTYSNVNWNVFCQAINSSASYTRFLQGRVYWLNIYNGTTAIRQFVPCYCTTSVTAYKGSTETTASAGTIGLFDLVNKRFYINSGSGTFTKGADVN